jgi:acyl carrier protein
MAVPAIDHDTVADTLTAYVNTRIMARGRRIQPDDEFETVGIDSMALLKILLFVEAEFGFWPPDADLVADNLRSPRALAHYICRRRSRS